VAFSNGSLLAGFVDRIMKRQPLSCPSDVKRFFVSPQESGEICLCACILGASGEILFPRLDAERDMVSFASIVAPFLKGLGFVPDICGSEQEAREKAAKMQPGKYPVYFFESNTSGEKLYEEFYTDSEELVLDTFSSLGVIRNAGRRNRDELNAVIQKLNEGFSGGVQKVEVVDLLNELLPGFHHLETGLNLDQKM
jgi:FlaA1/EpsC-like NDP-sugar epimerase